MHFGQQMGMQFLPVSRDAALVLDDGDVVKM